GRTIVPDVPVDAIGPNLGRHRLEFLEPVVGNAWRRLIERRNRRARHVPNGLAARVEYLKRDVPRRLCAEVVVDDRPDGGIERVWHLRRERRVAALIAP